MPLWKLEPLNLDDPNWQASTYRGEVIARAANEKAARLLAAKAYGIATKHEAGQTVKVVPWDYGGLVACTPVAATDDYAEDGDTEIVYPAQAVLSAHPRYRA